VCFFTNADIAQVKDEPKNIAKLKSITGISFDIIASMIDNKIMQARVNEIVKAVACLREIAAHSLNWSKTVFIGLGSYY